MQSDAQDSESEALASPATNESGEKVDDAATSGSDGKEVLQKEVLPKKTDKEAFVHGLFHVCLDSAYVMPS